MQTRFTDEQRQSKTIQLADDILRKCVHCGFCLATCPTYVLSGDERDSPRGRIYLMKEMFETGQGVLDVQRHLDRCLSCGSCETTCPSGVDYLKLASLGHSFVEEKGERSFLQRAKRHFLLSIMSNQSAFGLGLALGRMGKIFAPVLPAFARDILALVPPRQKAQTSLPVSGAAKKKRVILHEGCVQNPLRPNIDAATKRVLDRLGYEVISLPKFKCCGALADHMGKTERARVEAKRNIGAIMVEVEGQGVDAVISNASGCGTALKDHGHLMQDTELGREGAQVSELVKDLSEVLSDLSSLKAPASQDTTLAWQSPCSLQHGQNLGANIPDLLRHFGYDVAEPGEPHLCCGAAGTYMLLEPERAEALRTRKLACLAEKQPDIIVSANIGCISGLATKSDVPVRHYIEMIDLAMQDI